MDRVQLIKDITDLRDLAISLGYDWPSQNINEASTENLEDFYTELHLWLERQV